MTTETLMELQATFAAAISDALATSFSSANQATWTGKSTQAPLVKESSAERLLVQVVLDGKLKGALILDLPQTEAFALAQKFAEAGSEVAADEPSQVLLRLITSAAQDLPVKTATEFGSFSIASVDLIDEMDSSIDLEQGIFLDLTDDSDNQLSLTLHVTPNLLETLGTNISAPEAVADEPVTPTSEQLDPPAREAMNLDLVLDVELNVTLRFGQRILTLREILDLTSGSVVELDRQVEEPVELLLEGKVIARGEAVVIDGNYGLRVTEVPQPISAQLLS